MHDLYPEIAPYNTFTLPVDDLHRLYVEEVGNPDGEPVVFLHGGPGGGVSPAMRRLFDPARFRVILFDQRGAGQSVPHAELRQNTTWDLVADIEAIRERLGIAQWIVFGGSWGSTLALTYAETHPERVVRMVLRGIFLGRPEEIKWLNEIDGGASWVFPERWARYRDFIPADEQHELVEAYWRRLENIDAELRQSAAYEWGYWEGGISTLAHDPDGAGLFTDPKMMLSFARAIAHYFHHKLFLEPNQLLRDIGRIQHIPCAIVQGRYDMACPVKSAYELASAWPNATLKVVQGGHSAFEPEIRSALMAAMNSR